MNVEILNHPKGPYWQGQARGAGARLIFEWTGPIKNSLEPYGYPPDILYDQHPHRGFIPVGSQSHLYLVGLELTDGASWQTVIPKPEFKLTRPNGWKSWLLSKHPQWLEDEVSRIEKEVADIIKSRALVKIVFPPGNCYEVDLRKKFPYLP
ncbi:hypothetical protein [Phytobacter sp. V91]|uniref:hypothetical protein n=1 Tax=Phytobacter sp. V91 TaxID=3369425 RepID=UPI003F5F666A